MKKIQAFEIKFSRKKNNFGNIEKNYYCNSNGRTWNFRARALPLKQIIMGQKMLLVKEEESEKK